MPRTLYDKIWDNHVVSELPGGEALIYIDLHLIHEVTSPQAFAGLAEHGRKVRRPDLTLAVADHNTPTENQSAGVDNVADPAARLQLQTLEKNVKAHGIEYFPMGHLNNGIVHVVGPEQGRTRPGMTIVCGDSHTSTHGAFGALAHGIGTSEVEHVFATQTLRKRKAGNMQVRVNGELPSGVSGKDIALAIIGEIGTAGGTGMVIEFGGSAIQGLSMEGRMSLCNMSIEAGAVAGLIAPDQTTLDYLKARLPAADFEIAADHAQTLFSDTRAVFDKTVELDAASIAPIVTWGTSPQDVAPITGRVPAPESFDDENRASAVKQALDYMGLTPGTALQDVRIDRVFIGSCTNSRIEDLRAAAKIVGMRKVADGVQAMVVPGSGLVKAKAEAEGLDKIFLAAGFDWREPGCSMCLGMNPDKLSPGERCASTSNRNFEGRQGRGGRTHLMSPAMAAAAAVTGRLTDIRSL